MSKITWKKGTYGISGTTQKGVSRFVIYDDNDPCNYAPNGGVTLKDFDHKPVNSYHKNVRAAKRAAYRRIEEKKPTSNFTWEANEIFVATNDHYMYDGTKVVMFVGKNFAGSGAHKYAICRANSDTLLDTAYTLAGAKSKAEAIYKKG